MSLGAQGNIFGVHAPTMQLPAPVATAASIDADAVIDADDTLPEEGAIGHIHLQNAIHL